MVGVGDGTLEDEWSMFRSTSRKTIREEARDQIWSCRESRVKKKEIKVDSVRIEEIEAVLVWIRLYNLPSEYWEANILKVIGEKLGQFIMADTNLEDRKFGTYARIYMKMMPFHPLIDELEIHTNQGVWQ
ncbi:hypothetical protein SUGI_1010250 [Cryptomeria japonica]|nr:hypothetical protein SUGI_1010250 [Cryptomeria japonica]